MLLKLFEVWIDAVGSGWEILGAASHVCRHWALSPAFQRSLGATVWSPWLAERSGAAHCLYRPFSDKSQARGHFRGQGKQFSVQTNIMWHSLVLPPSSKEVCEG